MRPRRVAHLVESLGRGGLERVVLTLARRAGREGIAAEILCAVRSGAMAEEAASEGTPVRVIGAAGYLPRDILRTANALKAGAFDVVHSHGHFAGVLGRAAAFWSGTRAAVHHLHTCDTTLRGRHRRLERLLARATQRLVCCSQAVREHARREIGLPESLLAVVPNGIEPPPATSRERALERLGRHPAPLIGCVGSLAPHKGQAVLLRAIDRLPASCETPAVVIVGDGPERPALEGLAQSLRRAPRVLFLGERPDARDLLPAFELVVVPSLEREGFSLAAAEAMDAGIPVVASRLGGIPEVVEDGRTGLLVPPGDEAARAAALDRLLAAPDLRRAFGAEGRLRVEARFRAEAMARRIAGIYEEALHERRAA